MGRDLQEVTLRQADDAVVITINDIVMKVGDKKVVMDTTAVIIDSRAYIPLRFAGEALGFNAVFRK